MRESSPLAKRLILECIVQHIAAVVSGRTPHDIGDRIIGRMLAPSEAVNSFEKTSIIFILLQWHYPVKLNERFKKPCGNRL